MGQLAVSFAYQVGYWMFDDKETLPLPLEARVMLERHGPPEARWSLLWAVGPSFGRRRHAISEPDSRSFNEGPIAADAHLDLRRTEARLELAAGVMFRSRRGLGVLLSVSPYLVAYAGDAKVIRNQGLELLDYQQRWGASATLTWLVWPLTGSPGPGSRR